MKTVREVAKELNISRQAVYSKLTSDFTAKFTTKKKINNRYTLVISREGIEQLKSEVVKVDNQVDSKVDNELDSDLTTLLTKNIEVLQEQLKVKDNQISELNQRLKEQQELNKNNQILLHRQQEQPKILEDKKGITLIDKLKGLFKG